METSRKQLKLLVLGQGDMAEAILLGLKQLNCAVEILYCIRRRNKQSANIQLPIKQLNTPKSIQYINSLRSDYILLASWSEIIRPDTLNQLQIPIVNCHPSLLPLYRGPNPCYAMIKMGETESGATFHLVDSGIDTGAIVLQSPPFGIDKVDTWSSLRQKTFKAMIEQLPMLIHLLKKHKLDLLPQNNILSSYFPHATEQDFWINWALPAEQIARQCLAQQKLYPLITTFHGMKVLFQWGEVVTAHSGQIKPVLLEKAVPGQIIKSGINQFWAKTHTSNQIIKLFQPLIHNMPEWQSIILSPILFRPGQCFG